MAEEVALFTTTQVAREFGIDPSTVRRWALEGKITPATTTAGGHHRYLIGDVQAQVAALRRPRSPRRHRESTAPQPSAVASLSALLATARAEAVEVTA